jgi:hypothetical protein
LPKKGIDSPKNTWNRTKPDPKTHYERVHDNIEVEEECLDLDHFINNLKQFCSSTISTIHG